MTAPKSRTKTQAATKTQKRNSAAADYFWYFPSVSPNPRESFFLSIFLFILTWFRFFTHSLAFFPIAAIGGATTRNEFWSAVNKFPHFMQVSPALYFVFPLSSLSSFGKFTRLSGCTMSRENRRKTGDLLTYTCRFYSFRLVSWSRTFWLFF